MTTTPTKLISKPQAEPAEDQPEAGELVVSVQPEAGELAVSVQPEAGELAVIFTPELNEACLQSCRGGAIAWAFGPVANPTTLRINPGLNAPVPRKLWEQAKPRPDTQELMGRGLIQEIELTDGATTADGEVSLAAVPNAVAIRLIYGCRNTEQLEQWLRKEDRQVVREKLATRVKELLDGRP
jgi:hypothetical protein